MLLFPSLPSLRSHSKAKSEITRATDALREPDHLSFDASPRFFYQKLSSHKGGTLRARGPSHRPRRGGGGAVANVLLRCPVERPDDGGDDDEGPALGSGDAEDLARAFSAEAVVDLKKKTLEFEEREREEREREERKL